MGLNETMQRLSQTVPQRTKVSDSEIEAMRLIWQSEGKLKCKTCAKKSECVPEAISKCVSNGRKWYRAQPQRLMKTLKLVRTLSTILNK